MISRLSDWPERLAVYLKAAEGRPFCWGGRDGGHDCVLHALGAAEAITGIDVTSALRGTYDGALGAARRMKALYGSARLEEAAEAFRGRWAGERIPPLLAQRGDIVLADVPQPSLGVVGLGGRTAGFAAEAGGLLHVPLRLCRLAWRVG